MSGQYVCWETCQYVRLQVVGAPCWLGSLLLSLTGSEEQTNFPQPSLKMLKMASERSIHALLLFIGLFLKLFRWVSLKSVRAGKTRRQNFISETNQANIKMRIDVYYKFTCITSLRLYYSIIAITLRLIQSIFLIVLISLGNGFGGL